jgi:hypothetical protein
MLHSIVFMMVRMLDDTWAVGFEFDRHGRLMQVRSIDDPLPVAIVADVIYSLWKVIELYGSEDH